MSQVIVEKDIMILSIIDGEENTVEVTLPARPSIEFSATGPQGALGVGVPSGGTAGDLLVRTASGTGWTSTPTVDSIVIDTTASGVSMEPGKLRWNATEQTLDVGQLRGVVNQLGQETAMVCLNDSALTIGNGKPVMFTGTNAATGRPTIGPMVADGSVPGYYFFGVSTETIAPSGEGYIVSFGKVRGLDTSMYPPESLLWLDPTTPGEWTLTEPEAPNLKIAAAAVIVSDPTNGTLLVRADPGQDLADCHDVEVSEVQDGQYLGWSDNMQHWMPYSLPNDAPRSITISEPLAGDSFTLFRTSRATTIAGVTGLVAGDNPGVSYEVRYAANRTASGTLAIIPSIATSKTTGTTATVQNMPIPSGNYVWLNVTAVSGFASEFNLSIAF